MLGIEICQDAIKYLPLPYKWAGKKPDKGFDCSGLVRWVLVDDLGHDDGFPHGSYNQYRYCADGEIDVDDALTMYGCLLFRRKRIKLHGKVYRGPVCHVAITMPGYTIEAKGKRDGIGIWVSYNKSWDHACKIPGVEYPA